MTVEIHEMIYIGQSKVKLTVEIHEMVYVGQNKVKLVWSKRNSKSMQLSEHISW